MALLAISLAPLMQRAVDAAEGHNAGIFWPASTLLVIVLAAQVALGALARQATEAARAHIENTLRARAFAAVLDMPAQRAHGWHTADLMGRMTSDVSVVTDVLTTLPAQALSLTIRLLGALFVMALIAPQVAALLAALGCAGLVTSAVLRAALRRRHLVVQEAESHVRSIIQDCLEGLLVIRVFGAQDRSRQRAGRAMEGHLQARMRRASLSNLGTTGLSVAMRAGYALGFVWCGSQLLAGNMSAGSLIATVQLVGQLSSPLSGLGGIAARWASLAASSQRLMELESQDLPGCPDKVACAPASPAMGPIGAVPTDPVVFYRELSHIELDDVTFAYGGEAPVISHLSARIRKGMPTALLGPSGRGKSTLFRLLLGVYEPCHGSVSYVGLSPAGTPWRCPASHVPLGVVAYVPQGNMLLADTVAHAVALADTSEPDPARLAEALAAAQAQAFVAALPHGADTRLGERGGNLSEGQAQRLAVARALYCGAPIIMLDEATSALDAPTEALLLERLLGACGKTLVMASHRTATQGLCPHAIDLDAREDS